MRMLPTISIKKKDEPLLPQTIETPEKGLTDPETPEKVKAKTSTSTSTTKKTQKKKKILKGFLDGATSVLFTVLCLAPGKIVMGKLLLVGFYFRF